MSGGLTKDQVRELIEVLHSTSFFRHLPGELIEDLAGIIEIKTYVTGDKILSEGDENHKLYFLIGGALGIFVKGERVSKLQRIGDVIGEISLIKSSFVTATVIAEQDSRMIAFDLEQIKDKAPHLLTDIEKSQYKLFSFVLAEKLLHTNEKARQFEATNKELIEAKVKLEYVNQELEQRVNERTLDLVEKNKKLEQSISENRQLVRVLCHDLNNALSVVQLTTDRALLHVDRLDLLKNQELWNRIKRASHKQKELIDHVRQVSAVETGKTVSTLKKVNLFESIDSSFFIFKERLEDKEIEFTNKVGKSIFVMAEPISLSHSVINNLISNSIKFTPHGKKIEICGEIQNGLYILRIKDQGIGMPKDLLVDIFSMAKKTSRPGTDGEVGTGFGMPLVKAHMIAFGGDIHIESIPEEGTTCILKFKLAD